MLTNECWRLEAHRTGATLYVSGVACAISMSRALDQCDGLAPAVLALRVDLTGAHSVTLDALHIVSSRLEAWRRSRDGMARIERAKSPRSRTTLTKRDSPLVAPPRHSTVTRHTALGPA